MALHPNITHIHLGGDEVYTLGQSSLSQDIMQSHNFNKTGLYLYHMVPILQYVRKNYNAMPIIWDDMLRKIDLTLLQVCYTVVNITIHSKSCLIKL